MKAEKVTAKRAGPSNAAKRRQLEAMAKGRAKRAGIEWEMTVNDVRYYASLGPEWMMQGKEKPRRLNEMETVTLYGTLVRPFPPARELMEFRIFASDLDLSKTTGEMRVGHVQQQSDRMSAAVWVTQAQFGRIVAAACVGKVVWAKAHSDVLERGIGDMRSFAVSTDLPEYLEDGSEPA